MDLFSSDGLHLALRWFHVVAVITWLGHAYVFNWLDRRCTAAHAGREGEGGEGGPWMAHGGSFYRVEKVDGAPREPRATLHGFKWEAALAWISGFLLLTLTYHHGGGAMLLPPGSVLGPWQGGFLAAGTLLVGWLVYDALWASSFGSWRFAPAVGWVLIGALAWGLSQVLIGRAAYIHVGSMLGTIMVANVWRRIVPAHAQLLSASQAGTPADPELAKRAEQRSIHNDSLSLPVVFLMISNHFWGTYGHEYGWAILVLLSLAGVALRHLMNLRLSGKPGSPAVALALAAAILATWWVMRPPGDGGQDDEPVAVVHSVLPAVPVRDAMLGDAEGADASGGSEPTATGPSSGTGGGTGQVPSPVGPAPRATRDVHGVVHLEGEPPPPDELTLVTECQGLHTGPVHVASLLVRDGLLQNAFVRLIDGVDPALVPPAPDAAVVIDQRGCLYSPRIVGVRPGQGLRFVNSDPVLHNIHALPKLNREFNLGQPVGADPVDRRFKRAEIMVPIRCDVHPWMTAFVGVVDHPWFAVTDEAGAFVLEDVPDGTYRAEVWHELFGIQQTDVRVEEGMAELVFRYH